MRLPPDRPPPSPAKPKLTPEERCARHADRLASIRLRMAIGRELDDRGITTPAAIGEFALALGRLPGPAAHLRPRAKVAEGVSPNIAR